ncbi:MAG: DedA family protein [Burkholderiaceae bacterium]
MTERIIAFIESGGYVAIAFLMALENIFPPIPSELIMPFAGLAAARGELGLAGVVAAGTVGSLIGTLPWYWLGRSVGRKRLDALVEKHGRWFAVTPGELQRAHELFDRHGNMILAAGRLIPAVRSVISLPAGIYKVPLGRLLLWSGIGTALWSGALAGGGYLLESRYEALAGTIDVISKAVVGMLVAAWLWRVVRGPRGKP